MVLFYPHIGLHTGDEKFRIHSRKTETATNITIHKMAESIESNTILENTDDEGVIQVLLNLRYIVIVVELVSSIKNYPYSTSLVFNETIVKD